MAAPGPCAPGRVKPGHATGTYITPGSRTGSLGLCPRDEKLTRSRVDHHSVGGCDALVAPRRGAVRSDADTLVGDDPNRRLLDAFLTRRARDRKRCACQRCIAPPFLTPGDTKGIFFTDRGTMPTGAGSKEVLGLGPVTPSPIPDEPFPPEPSRVKRGPHDYSDGGCPPDHKSASDLAAGPRPRQSVERPLPIRHTGVHEHRAWPRDAGRCSGTYIGPAHRADAPLA